MSNFKRKKDSGAAYRNKRKVREEEDKILSASFDKYFKATKTSVNQENVEALPDDSKSYFVKFYLMKSAINYGFYKVNESANEISMF